MLPRAAEVPFGVGSHAGCRPRLHAHHVALAHLAEVPAVDECHHGGAPLGVVVLQQLAAPWRGEGVPHGALAEGAEACGGERVAASRALVGDVVLALGDQKHEHLGAAPTPAAERAVGAVHQDALVLGRGLLALGLGSLALNFPVDYQAAHVHPLFDAEVQAELGLHVMSSRLVRWGDRRGFESGVALERSARAQGSGTGRGRRSFPRTKYLLTAKEHAIPQWHDLTILIRLELQIR